MEQTEQQAQINALEIALDNLRGLLNERDDTVRYFAMDYMRDKKKKDRKKALHHNAIWDGISQSIDVIEKLIADIKASEVTP